MSLQHLVAFPVCVLFMPQRHHLAGCRKYSLHFDPMLCPPDISRQDEPGRGHVQAEDRCSLLARFIQDGPEPGSAEARLRLNAGVSNASESFGFQKRHGHGEGDA